MKGDLREGPVRVKREKALSAGFFLTVDPPFSFFAQALMRARSEIPRMNAAQVSGAVIGIM